MNLVFLLCFLASVVGVLGQKRSFIRSYHGFLLEFMTGVRMLNERTQKVIILKTYELKKKIF